MQSDRKWDTMNTVTITNNHGGWKQDGGVCDTQRLLLNHFGKLVLR